MVDPEQTANRGPSAGSRLFNLAIDSKLRGCDAVAIKVEDVAPNGYTADRATIRQRKTGQPVRFELTEQTRQAVDDYLRATQKMPGQYLFSGRRGSGHCMTTRQYARLVSEWTASIGLDPHAFGTHSLRRTKATLIYRRTGNLRAVQLLLGTKGSRAQFDILASRSTTPSRLPSNLTSRLAGQSGSRSALFRCA
jgi:integrase